jgi:ribosomal protein S12 methylthiotransferase
MPSAVEPTARVHFLTLGCPKNEADSRTVLRRLAAAGAMETEDPAGATHIVVNTCGFIEDAKQESIDAILSVCADYPGKQVLVVGCLVERYRHELEQGIPEVAGWFGVVGDDVTGELVRVVAGGEQTPAKAVTARISEVRSYAYIKISDGCDESCTFCAIPGFKGTYESVATEVILREVDACLAEGAKELVLVGQDTTRWQSGELDLRGLIHLLGEDARVTRIRVMYLQPARLDDAFLEFMASHRKLCNYLDVPFQHSHREILRRMGRRGDGAAYQGMLARAREVMPGATLRSTFIVGFPGETDKHFEHLLEFVRAARFEYGGGFVYSPEEGTVAASFGSGVRLAVARKRLNTLNDAMLESGERERSRLVGAEVEVMIDSLGGEESIEEAVAIGRTEGQAPEVDGVTYLRGQLPDDVAVGDVVRVLISDVWGCDLIGEFRAS